MHRLSKTGLGPAVAIPFSTNPDLYLAPWGMIERTFSCPIVYEVVEDLKQYTGLLGDRRR
ncbi:MAG TPA: hypothetical protein VI320_25605 [Terracidiphilus sp.]